MFDQAKCVVALLKLLIANDDIKDRELVLFKKNGEEVLIKLSEVEKPADVLRFPGKKSS